MNRTNRVHSSRSTSRRYQRTGDPSYSNRSNDEDSVASLTPRRRCFARSIIFCLVVVGALILRYPGFIQDNINSNGGIELKFDNIITRPLNPQHEIILGLEHFFMLPPKNSTVTGDPKGILIYLHSCQQTGLDLFTLPEHRIIAKRAIEKGLAVFSPTSHNQTTGCFTFEDSNRYLERVVNQFAFNHRLYELPRFGLGDSSGGTFLTHVHRALQLESIAVYNSPQRLINKEKDTENTIPTAYLTMSADVSVLERITANMLTLQEMNVSTTLFKVSPRPFTEALCEHRLPELSTEFCQLVFRTIEKDYPMLLDSKGYVVRGDANSTEWRSCFQKLDEEYKSLSNSDGQVVRGRTRRSDSLETKPWWQVIVEQEIQTSLGFHAMTAQFHDEILNFLISNSKMNANNN